MKLQTITTIELSSICNLECKYCINRLLVKHPSRRAGIMADEVFERTLYWLRALVMRGTQQEVNMNGNGESCLDPKVCERIRAVKEVMNGGRVLLSTNGMNMTPDLARRLKDTGIDNVDISVHSPYEARRAAQLVYEVELRGFCTMGPVVAPHNWAGQLEEDRWVKFLPHPTCHPLKAGWGYVQSEGNVTPCCYDYRNLGVFGSVFDDDLLEREIRPYSLCRTCHQRIEDLSEEDQKQGRWT